jgi:trk system potassium uptake protein
MLRRISELPLLVILMGIAALAMYLPALHGLVLKQHDVARPFFYGGTVLLTLTAMIAIATANRRPRDVAHSHLTAFVAAYLVIPLMLALPFHQALRDTSFADAWFEMVSSLTTTGATLFDDPASLSPTLHLWRAFVGWLGGLFILVAAMAILAPLNLGGVEVISGRSPGGGRQDVRIADPSQRILRQVVVVLPVYTGLTLILWLMLTVAGEAGFVALCHAMATLSSSGISPVGGLQGASAGITGEILISLFLFFAVTRRSLPGSTLFNHDRPLWADPELHLALMIVAFVAGVMVLRHWIGSYAPGGTDTPANILRATWGVIFTSLSFLTTTGFVSQDWVASRFWSDLGSPGLILAGLAMVGGGIATTAGGVKLIRVYALFRQGERELERQVHPRSVGGSGPSARRLRREGAYLAWIFFVLFGISIGTVAALISLTGEDFERSLMFAISAISTTGPLAPVGGETAARYAELGPAAKFILGAAMIVGRIETLAILTLIAADPWPRQ